jgi:hypothetical protein
MNWIDLEKLAESPIWLTSAASLPASQQPIWSSRSVPGGFSPALSELRLISDLIFCF